MLIYAKSYKKLHYLVVGLKTSTRDLSSASVQRTNKVDPAKMTFNTDKILKYTSETST